LREIVDYSSSSHVINTNETLQTDMPHENGSVKLRNKSSGRSVSEPLATFFTIRLDSVEFKLKTETGTPIEPYYLSVSLWDVKNGRKISEDFHTTVDINGKLVGNQKVCITDRIQSFKICNFIRKRLLQCTGMLRTFRQYSK
jgi:hypothetical protein